MQQDLNEPPVSSQKRRARYRGCVQQLVALCFVREDPHAPIGSPSVSGARKGGEHVRGQMSFIMVRVWTRYVGDTDSVEFDLSQIRLVLTAFHPKAYQYE
jgi:hypothetical protein